MTPSERLWLPLASGPVLFGLLVSAGRLAGLSLAGAAWTAVAAGALLAVAPVRTGRGAGEGSDPMPGGSRPPAPVIAALLFVLLLGALPPLLFPAVRFRADAQLHLPVLERVLAGSFPPENPFLAGEPLAYFWFYHVVLGGVVALTALPADLALSLFNVQALLVLLFAVDAAARRLGMTPGGRALAILLCGVGLSPQGAPRLLVSLRDHDRGWEWVMEHGVRAVLPLLSPEDPRLAAFLSKIAVSNAFPMSLALMVTAALLSLARIRSHPDEGPPVRTGAVRLQAVLVTAGAILFHPITGGLAVLGLGVGSLFAARRQGRWSTLADLATLAIAAGLSLPFALAALSGRTGGSALEITFRPGKALALHAALAGVWLLALAAARRWLGKGSRPIWLAMALPGFLLPWLARMVDGNEYKGLFVLLPFLALPAAEGVLLLARRSRGLAVVVVALFLPTALLAAGSYALESLPPHLVPERRRALADLSGRIEGDPVLWSIDTESPYSPWSIPLRRPFYLSDRYALSIMGQWEGPAGSERQSALAGARGGHVAEALAASRRQLGGRGLVAVVSASDVSRFPFLVPELSRLGAREIGRSGDVALYEVPP
jgi:hypothetical protein